MAPELTDEERAFVDECVRAAIGGQTPVIDYTQIHIDPSEALKMIKADKEAFRAYVQMTLIHQI